jgi:protein-tyrosine-phosphatase
MPSLLFVCSANQLRSPLAEVLFRSHLERRGLGGAWQVASAGVWALEGSPAARAALQTAASRGLNLAQHVARPVTEELLRGADLVLVMEREHRDALQEAFPSFGDRIHLMSEMVGEAGEVEDPIGLPLERVRSLMDELERILQAGWPRIRALAEAGASASESGGTRAEASS